MFTFVSVLNTDICYQRMQCILVGYEQVCTSKQAARACMQCMVMNNIGRLCVGILHRLQRAHPLTAMTAADNSIPAPTTMPTRSHLPRLAHTDTDVPRTRASSFPPEPPLADILGQHRRGCSAAAA